MDLLYKLANALFKIKGDKQLRIVFITLMCISVVLVFTSTSVLAWQKQNGNLSYYPFRHIFYLALSWICTSLISRLDPKIFNRFAMFLCIIGIALSFLTFVCGVSINGSTRWIKLGAVQFQPSEIAKITLIFFVAKVLSIHKINPGKAFWPIVIATILIIVPIITQNLSTAVLIVTTVTAMVIIGSIPMKYLITSAVAVCGLVSVIVFVVPEQYQPERLKTWKGRVFRFADSDSSGDSDKNYQAMQAKLAVAHSGFLGTGPGRSYVKNFLPMAYSDFVYSTILEECGIWGGLGVIVLFLWMLYRVIRIAQRCDSAFEIYLILGLAIILCLQAFINMAVGVGLIPVTGQTLPLISMGGTSNVIVGVVMGVIFSISSHNMPKEKQVTSTQKQEVSSEFSNDDVDDDREE